MTDTVRWQPKANYEGDKPMYMKTNGGWVTYSDFHKIYEENQKLTAEVTKLYLELNDVKEAANGA